jgi:putative transposase
MRDRRRYLHWVFEAKKRFGVSVLNYMVTSNHIHLLVRDTGPEVIAQSMQLIAGHNAQEYNQRKNRQGAFWRDQKGQVFLLLVSRVVMGSFYSSH